MPNIGKYEIESRIGHGGMGDVYRAFDPTLRRKVAIKVLKVEGDTENLNRFRLEATSAGNLNHPNIVTIHDYGDFEGAPYIVMEYLEGEDLQRAIDGGKKFDLVEITDIMSQVADALECAHQAGVIHRDVKPANIMLLNKAGSGQNVKLMDFGIARLAGGNTQQTKVGHLIGTVLYMSPEQFHNLDLDRRVDIWAYGVIYYQLLAGKHPFAVQDQIVTMYNIANKPAPPICSINQDVPEALGQIVDRCLSKDRDQRYHTMEDLRFDVLPVLQDLSRQQAARMLGEAHKQIELNDWDAANTIIKRVLELDPGDRNALAIRRTIADALRKRESAPRINNLVAAAEQHIEAKQHAKALEVIETALKIDPAAETLRKRASEVRELMEREKRTQELLQAARQDLATEHYTGAYQNATEVLRYDPGRADALQLLASVQEEMARRERQRVLREGADQARNLIKQASYDEAITLLRNLNANYPGTLEFSQLLREAESLREIDQHNRSLNDALNGVKELLRNQRFPDAVQRLEALTKQFPGEKDLIEMLRYAREEWKVRQRTEALDRVKSGVAQLQNEGRFDEAVRLIERSLVEFPQEPGLLRLMQAVTSTKAEADRRAALEQIILDAASKKNNGNLTEALKVVDLGIQQYGPDERLLGVREQLEKDWRAAQRNQSFQKLMQEGSPLVRDRQWEKAIAHYKNVVKQFPDEAEPRKLLADAEASLVRERQERADREERERKERAEKELRERRERAEADATSRAAALAAQNQKDAALAEIETVLREFPNSQILLETKARLQKEIAAAKATQERELKLFEARRKAEEETRRRAQELEEKAAEQRRQIATRVEDALAKAYLAIGQADFAKASKMIADAQRIDSTNTSITRAQSDLASAQNLANQQTAARAAVQPVKEESKPFPVKAVAIGAVAAVAVLAGAYFLLNKPAEAPAFDVSPQSAAFTSTATGTPSAPVNIALTGSGAFAAKATDPWISVAPESGTLPSSLTVSSNPKGLAPGSYNGTLDISTAAAAKHVAVTLTVAAPKIETPPPIGEKPPPPAQPEISLSPEALSFSYEAGSPEPAPRQIYVSGNGHFQASVANGRLVSVNPASGNIPGPLSIAVHPVQLPPGQYATQVTVVSTESASIKKFATIRVTVTEAPRKPVVPEKKPDPIPVVVTPPSNPPPPVTPQIPPAQKCSSEGYLNGVNRLEGQFVWNGKLDPGGKVAIGPAGVIVGSGSTNGPLVPRLACFDVSNLTPGVRAATSASMLVLTNVSSATINTISVAWAVK